MKITIDTKEDSHEDIRKVIQILLQVSGNPSSPFSNASSSSPDTSNMMDMFSDAPSASSMTTSLPDRNPGTPPDFSSFLSLTAQRKEEKKEDIPKIEFF